MTDRIAGVVDALGGRTIGDVDRIIVRLGDVGPPLRTALLSPGYAPHHTRTPLREGVRGVGIGRTEMGEARSAVRPALRPVGFDIAGSAVHARIAVDDDLGLLHVALARQQHAGPGIFEHGHHVGQHVALRIKVLARLPQARTLPAPAVLLLVEIAAVALPQGDMPSGQPPLRRAEPRKRLDQRTFAAVREAHGAPHPRGIAAGEGDQLADLAAVRNQLDARLAEFARQHRTHRVVHRPHVLLAERVIGEADRGLDSHAAPRDLRAHDLHVAARDLARDDARERAPHLRALLPREFPRADAPNGEKRQNQSCYDSISHDV